MINDLKMGFRVLKYGLSFKASIFAIIIFLILGCAMELLGADMPLSGAYTAISALYMAQMIHSFGVCSMVQTSPYKKRLQTIIPAYVTFISLVVVTTFQLVIKMAVNHLFERTEAELSNSILFTAIIMSVVTLYVGGAFKAFWPSTVLFTIGFMVVYSVSVYYMFKLRHQENAITMVLPLGVSILVSYLMIIVDCIFIYFMFLALYKKEYSKITFGTALKRAK